MKTTLNKLVKWLENHFMHFFLIILILGGLALIIDKLHSSILQGIIPFIFGWGSCYVWWKTINPYKKQKS